MTDAKIFWQQRYEAGQTGWDLGDISPPLKHIIDGISDKSLHILIPGCGNGHEARYLMQTGFTDVTVIDIAPAPVERLKDELSDYINAGKLTVLCADFFEHTEQYDYILEQTFFCAIEPVMRQRYAEKVCDLLKQGSILTGVLFNRDFDGGPPFGGSVQEYETYFGKLFKSVQFESCNVSITPRAGTEVFIRAVK